MKLKRKKEETDIRMGGMAQKLSITEAMYLFKNFEMSGWRPPCGACKFLRRRCHVGCILAPHFCHEDSATQFAAIHRMFGASNISKLLSCLPPIEQYEAAHTINYEAQARLRDLIYGCVSDIYALTQQVEILQAHLAILKDQAPSSSKYPSNVFLFTKPAASLSAKISPLPLLTQPNPWNPVSQEASKLSAFDCAPSQYEDPRCTSSPFQTNNVNVVVHSSEIDNEYSEILEVDNPNDK